jgi:hypothetical protein
LKRKPSKKQMAHFLSDFLLGCLFDPDDGGSTVLQIGGGLLPNYMAVHPRKKMLF